MQEHTMRKRHTMALIAALVVTTGCHPSEPGPQMVEAMTAEQTADANEESLDQKTTTRSFDLLEAVDWRADIDELKDIYPDLELKIGLAGLSSIYCQPDGTSPRFCVTMFDGQLRSVAQSWTVTGAEALSEFDGARTYLRARHDAPVIDELFASPNANCTVVTTHEGASLAGYADDNASRLDWLEPTLAKHAVERGQLCGFTMHHVDAYPYAQARVAGDADGYRVTVTHYTADLDLLDREADARWNALRNLERRLDALQREVDALAP